MKKIKYLIFLLVLFLLSCDWILYRDIYRDFASVWGIPCVSEILAGKANKAATLHDWCYRTGCVPRSKADELLWEATLAEESNKNLLERYFIADSLYIGVRAGGRSAYQGKQEWND